MKKTSLLLSLFVFIIANSQVNDSLKKMEEQRLFNEGYFENITGKALPDFTANDLNGTIYTGYMVRKGKVTFINCWFTGCSPCIAEIPHLNKLYNTIKDNPNVQFIAVTSDQETQAKKTIKEYDIHFPVLLMTENEAEKINFGRGYPTNMVIDKEGNIRSILSGGSSNAGNEFEKYWNREIDKVLRGDTIVAQPAQASKNIPGIIFIDSSKIQSLNDLTNYFKDKSLYIDVWASWCLPCRQEFSVKNDSVDSFFNRHKIVRLYLSIDDAKVKETWENLVYKYQLTGYHLLAGSRVQKDLQLQVYKNGRTMDIPRYIILKNGKIVELNAFHPSDGEKLIKQLTERLL